MDILENVLVEIKNGKKKFSPTGQYPDNIENFQNIAKALDYANSKGFIDGYLAHRNTETNEFYYDFVMVTNGLSYRGKLFLENYEKQEQNEMNEKQEKSKNDILLLKPSIFGVGIDLKAVWNLLKKKK